MLRDKALVELRKKLKKAEQERDELKLKLAKFQTSSKNLSKLLASKIIDKTRLGYDNHVFNSIVFDSYEFISFESDVSMPSSLVHDRYQSGEGYHAVSPPYTETFMPPKPNLVFPDAPTVNETVPTALHVEPSPTKPNKPSIEHPIPASTFRKDIPNTRGHRQSRNRKACVVFLIRSRLIPLTTARPVNIAVSQTNVIGPRPAKNVVTKPHSPPRVTINHRPSPNPSKFPQKVTIIKAPHVTAVKGVLGNWDKGVIDSGCSRHITGNISYLSDFEAINGGYVAFSGNPKGGKITGKGKIKTRKLDFDDVYFVKELKFNLFSVSQMSDKKNIVLFTETKCLVLSSDFKLPNENHVLLRVPIEKNMYNVDLKNIVPSGDLTCLLQRLHWMSLIFGIKG
nr:ribonuclease H-like domain-containing protein [Tanacetum cinerariifolium]